MKTVLLGTVKFSERMLDKLLAMRVPVLGIVTAPNGSGYADYADLTRRAGQEGIPVLEVTDANHPETVSWLSALKPDYLFCFGWSQILGAEILSVPRQGTIGYHPAALPENRGRHPIIWAIVLGLDETGSTFFMLDQGVDSGPIVSQVRVAISRQDDAESLYAKLVTEAEKQLEQFIPLIEAGSLPSVEQDLDSSSYWRRRNAADGEIDWRMAADTISRTVRGLGKPYVGAHFMYEGRPVKLWRCSVEESVPKNAEPGKVLDRNGHRILVKTGVGGVWLEKTDPQVAPDRGTYL